MCLCPQEPPAKRHLEQAETVAPEAAATQAKRRLTSRGRKSPFSDTQRDWMEQQCREFGMMPNNSVLSVWFVRGKEAEVWGEEFKLEQLRHVARQFFCR